MPVENWSEQVVIVHLCDEPQFAEDMESLEKAMQQKKRDAVLDLSAVHYVNSSNIARLLRLRKQMIGSQRKLRLCALTTQVWGAFLTTGLDKIFDFNDDVPTALASLQLN